MKKYILLAITAVILTGCSADDDFLKRKPTNAFPDEDTWRNESLIYSNLADLYVRYNDYQSTQTWYTYCDFEEGYSAAVVDQSRHKKSTYGYAEWASWDYGYIRHLNLFIEKCSAAADEVFVNHTRDRLVAEARFLRAAYYFELAKRMGGVPLVTESLTYDYSGDPTYLQHPRKKEHEIYDFVLAELEGIKNALPDDANVKSRATKAAALAIRSRAALYAGSIAKYGALRTPTVKTDGWEVGIPATMADGYYKIALDAAEEIIIGGKYDLYEKNPDNRSENFASLFLDKDQNPEAIFVRDYKKPTVRQWWTQYSLPISMRESTGNGSFNATLNFVQLFELVNGNEIKSLDVGTWKVNPTAYDNPLELFAGRDPRLAGTIILPGSSFRGQAVDILTGYFNAVDGTTITGNLGEEKDVPGIGKVRVTGFDGPRESVEYGAHSGFYVRKYNDPTPGSGEANTGSDVWFIRFRYAEVLLNAAEAAFEHSTQQDIPKAKGYLNEVRQRAGFTTDLEDSDITFDRIVHERRVELAYEGHNFWDMKRWRLAHIAWDGTPMAGQVSDPTTAGHRNTQALGLHPYRVYNAGANDGKWIFEVRTLNAAGSHSHQFRLGNYYSQINSTILSNNPQLVKQPNQ